MEFDLHDFPYPELLVENFHFNFSHDVSIRIAYAAKFAHGHSTV